MGFCHKDVSSQEKSAQAQTDALTKQMTQQATQIMGSSMAAFNKLMGAYTPIVDAGPNQEGYGPAQMSALKSMSITATGVAGRNALAAVRGAPGGGLPSGARIGAEMGTANAVSQQGAAQQLQIEEQSKELGYKKFESASSAMAGLPNMFNAATNAGNTAVNAGKVNDQAAQNITAVQNQPGWGMGLLSAAAKLGGMALTGGMSGLAGGLVGGLGAGLTSTGSSFTSQPFSDLSTAAASGPGGIGGNSYEG